MRKDTIINILENSDKPIKGADLAKLVEVSRQVVVQDIALMRAQGLDIIATPQGYMLNRRHTERSCVRVFACQHEGLEAMRDELETIVSFGGQVLNVIVEHPVYGEITANLSLSNLHEVGLFIEKVQVAEAMPLSVLTKGIHLHTVEAKNQEILQQIAHTLLRKHYLVEDFKNPQEES